MRWSVVALAVIGVAQGAGAGELKSEYLRGSDVYGAPPAYPIIQSAPPQGWHPAPNYPVKPGPAQPVVVVPPPPAPFNFTVEVGTRYWYSSGKLAKDLFDDPRFSNLENSRLTYDRLTSNTFEAFGTSNAARPCPQTFATTILRAFWPATAVIMW
jgi:hypothetical protein